MRNEELGIGNESSVVSVGYSLRRASRLIAALKGGNSMPFVMATESGTYLTKLRGAAQGTAALVAEIIVAELAEALGLPVPKRVLIEIDKEVESDDQDPEVLQLLEASRGLNLGFVWMEGASVLRLDQRYRIDDEMAGAVLWLDAFVMNIDRTELNPNILLWKRLKEPRPFLHPNPDAPAHIQQTRPRGLPW